MLVKGFREFIRQKGCPKEEEEEEGTEGEEKKTTQKHCR